MPTFMGENIVPKVYENTTPRLITRWELVQEIYKVLLAFGFKRVYPWGTLLREMPIDMVDEDEVGFPNFTNADPTAILLDFPDSIDFVNAGNGVNFDTRGVQDPFGTGRTFRPCFMIAVGQTFQGGSDEVGHDLFFDLVIRDAFTTAERRLVGHLLSVDPPHAQPPQQRVQGLGPRQRWVLLARFGRALHRRIQQCCLG